MLASRRTRLVAGTIALVAITALVVALVGMGARPFAQGFVLHADFGQLDQLREGNEVRISALRAGRVTAIRRLRQEPLHRVRVDLWLERAVAPLVRSNSLCYVSAKGFIGERHLEIGPPPNGAAPGPPIVSGQVLRGVDSPPLDHLLQSGYESLHALRALGRELAPEIQAFGAARAQLARTLQDIAPTASEGRALATLVQDVRSLADSRGIPLGEGKRLTRLLSALGAVQSAVAEEPPMPALSAGLFSGFGELFAASQLAGSRLQTSLGALVRLLPMLRVLTAGVTEGHGTIGRLLHDPQLRDELKAVQRLLNRQPWRARPRPGGPR